MDNGDSGAECPDRSYSKAGISEAALGNAFWKGRKGGLSVIPKVLGLITARGGSKGLPRKNILPLHGKPLIAWTIEAALRSKHITNCVVSSEDDEILAISRQWGAETPFVRPAHFATDTCPTMEVVLHALDTLAKEGRTYNLVVLLQPTSPLRMTSDIDEAITLCLVAKAPCCVSVCRMKHSPFWSYSRHADGRLTPLLPTHPATRRQDLPAAYRLNGAVYVADTAWLKETKTFMTPDTIGYIMPEGRSGDIDDATDFHLIELFLSGAI